MLGSEEGYRLDDFEGPLEGRSDHGMEGAPDGSNGRTLGAVVGYDDGAIEGLSVSKVLLGIADGLKLGYALGPALGVNEGS